MRIVHVIPFAHPATQFGGPVAQLALVAPEMARRGHDVRVVATDMGIGPDISRDQWLDKDGYRIWYGSSTPMSRVAPYWSPFLRRPLREAFDGGQIVHLHLGLTVVNSLASQMAAEMDVPSVYSPRGSLCPERLKIKPLAKAGFLRLFERPTIRRAAGLHALSTKERADLIAQGAAPDRIHIVPNAVDLTRAIEGLDRQECRAQLNLRPSEIMVLFLSQLHQVKGLDLLVKSVARLHKRYPELVLLIAGSDAGYEREARRLVAAEGITTVARFVGHADDAQKARLLRAADIFSLMSYSEGMPNAVLEACSAGLPCVVTPQCNLPEVATARAGLVAPTDLESQLKSLETLVESPALREEMGRNAKALANERFSVSGVVDGLEKIYAASIASRKLVRPLAAQAAPSTFLSIITPTFNAAATVERTLRSLDCIPAEARPGVEVLIADDGSTDSTFELVKKHTESHPDFQWRLLKLPHGGVSATRNAAIDAATGTWIMFLDADDELVADVTLPLRTNTQATVYIYATSYWRGGKVISRRPARNLTTQNWLAAFTAGNPLPISSIVFRRELIDSKFTPAVSFGEDWLFWVSNPRFYTRTVVRPDVVSSFVHIHSGNTSRNVAHAGAGREQVATLIEKQFTHQLTKTQLNNLRLQKSIGRLLHGEPIGGNLLFPVPCNGVLLLKYAVFLGGRIVGKTVTQYR